MDQCVCGVFRYVEFNHLWPVIQRYPISLHTNQSTSKLYVFIKTSVFMFISVCCVTISIINIIIMLSINLVIMITSCDVLPTNCALRNNFLYVWTEMSSAVIDPCCVSTLSIHSRLHLRFDRSIRIHWIAMHCINRQLLLCADNSYQRNVLLCSGWLNKTYRRTCWIKSDIEYNITSSFHNITHHLTHAMPGFICVKQYQFNRWRMIYRIIHVFNITARIPCARNIYADYRSALLVFWHSDQIWRVYAVCHLYQLLLHIKKHELV